MSDEWEYLVRLEPAVVRCAEPLTVHVDKAKLAAREDGLTLELWELDNFVYRLKGETEWTVIEDEGQPFDPVKQKRNPDDLIASWNGGIVLAQKDGAASHTFVPKGDVTLAERVQKSQAGRKLALETKFGRLVPIRFEGSDKVWEIPMPFDGTEEDPRDGEGPRLELALSLRRGQEVLYRGGVQSFVTDWRWWASTSFAPPRDGNSVDFFADGEQYFKRLYDAMRGARKHIYITDWKMNPYEVLVRDGTPPEPGYPPTATTPGGSSRPSPSWDEHSVANVLAAAAQRGVDVRVLLYDTPPMQDNADDMTACYLIYRGVAVAAHNPAGEQNLSGRNWSHHQKSVMVDGERAFVGGLDLAENRWDTSDHGVFDERADPNTGLLSNQTKNRDRFLCGGYEREGFDADVRRHAIDPVADKGAWGARHPGPRTDRPPLPRERVPRMPWHDTHCELRGPSVHDVERNFVQRWNRSCPGYLKTLTQASDSIEDYFIKTPYPTSGVPAFSPGKALERIQIARRQAEYCRHAEAGRFWDEILAGRPDWSQFVAAVQDKAYMLLVALPDLPLEAPQVAVGKDIVQVVRSLEAESIVPAAHIKVEKSILECYLRAIENAEHFIYLESQMFLSKYLEGTAMSRIWDEKKGPLITGWKDVENPLARRIADKVLKKIKAGVPFHVYIILPEIYDGDPFEEPGREIQLYQFATIVSLLEVVAPAARAAGFEADEYLSFYALRNAGLTTDGQGRVRSNLVYVHSKLLIVDDVFLTVGSANANDRSMTGYRDTELNVAVAGDRDRVATLGHDPWRVSGKIRDFRMRLWREHLGAQAKDAIIANASHPMTIALWRDAAWKGYRAYDSLYQDEMKLLDLIDKELEIVRTVHAHPELAGAHAAELAAIRREQDRLQAQTVQKYQGMRDLGHIILHPYNRRSESKGNDSFKIPDAIAK